MLNRARGERHPCWKGGVNRHANGYVLLMRKEHPRANRDGYVMEHILVAESAIGFYLPDGVEVHHINGIRDDNGHKNLVVCQDHTYHLLLHQRARAKKEIRYSILLVAQELRQGRQRTQGASAS